MSTPEFNKTPLGALNIPKFRTLMDGKPASARIKFLSRIYYGAPSATPFLESGLKLTNFNNATLNQDTKYNNILQPPPPSPPVPPFTQIFVANPTDLHSSTTPVDSSQALANIKKEVKDFIDDSTSPQTRNVIKTMLKNQFVEVLDRMYNPHYGPGIIYEIMSKFTTRSNGFQCYNTITEGKKGKDQLEWEQKVTNKCVKQPATGSPPDYEKQYECAKKSDTDCSSGCHINGYKNPAEEDAWCPYCGGKFLTREQYKKWASENVTKAHGSDSKESQNPYYPQCEHVIPFLQAGFLNLLYTGSDKKPENSIEYLYAHAKCNGPKSDSTFIKLQPTQSGLVYVVDRENIKAFITQSVKSQGKYKFTSGSTDYDGINFSNFGITGSGNPPTGWQDNLITKLTDELIVKKVGPIVGKLNSEVPSSPEQQINVMISRQQEFYENMIFSCIMKYNLSDRWKWLNNVKTTGAAGSSTGAGGSGTPKKQKTTGAGGSGTTKKGPAPKKQKKSTKFPHKISYFESSKCKNSETPDKSAIIQGHKDLLKNYSPDNNVVSDSDKEEFIRFIEKYFRTIFKDFGKGVIPPLRNKNPQIIFNNLIAAMLYPQNVADLQNGSYNSLYEVCINSTKTQLIKINTTIGPPGCPVNLIEEPLNFAEISLDTVVLVHHEGTFKKGTIKQIESKIFKIKVTRGLKASYVNLNTKDWNSSPHPVNILDLISNFEQLNNFPGLIGKIFSYDPNNPPTNPIDYNNLYEEFTTLASRIGEASVKQKIVGRAIILHFIVLASRDDKYKVRFTSKNAPTFPYSEIELNKLITVYDGAIFRPEFNKYIENYVLGCMQESLITLDTTLNGYQLKLKNLSGSSADFSKYLKDNLIAVNTQDPAVEINLYNSFENTQFILMKKLLYIIEIEPGVTVLGIFNTGRLTKYITKHELSEDLTQYEMENGSGGFEQHPKLVEIFNLTQNTIDKLTGLDTKYNSSIFSFATEEISEIYMKFINYVFNNNCDQIGILKLNIVLPENCNFILNYEGNEVKNPMYDARQEYPWSNKNCSESNSLNYWPGYVINKYTTDFTGYNTAYGLGRSAASKFNYQIDTIEYIKGKNSYELELNQQKINDKQLGGFKYIENDDLMDTIDDSDDSMDTTDVGDKNDINDFENSNFKIKWAGFTTKCDGEDLCGETTYTGEQILEETQTGNLANLAESLIYNKNSSYAKIVKCDDINKVVKNADELKCAVIDKMFKLDEEAARAAAAPPEEAGGRGKRRAAAAAAVNLKDTQTIVQTKTYTSDLQCSKNCESKEGVSIAKLFSPTEAQDGTAGYFYRGCLNSPERVVEGLFKTHTFGNYPDGAGKGSVQLIPIEFKGVEDPNDDALIIKYFKSSFGNGIEIPTYLLPDGKTVEFFDEMDPDDKADIMLFFSSDDTTGTDTFLGKLAQIRDTSGDVATNIFNYLVFTYQQLKKLTECIKTWNKGTGGDVALNVAYTFQLPDKLFCKPSIKALARFPGLKYSQMVRSREDEELEVADILTGLCSSGVKDNTKMFSDFFRLFAEAYEMIDAAKTLVALKQQPNDGMDVDNNEDKKALEIATILAGLSKDGMGMDMEGGVEGMQFGFPGKKSRISSLTPQERQMQKSIANVNKDAERRKRVIAMRNRLLKHCKREIALEDLKKDELKKRVRGQKLTEGTEITKEMMESRKELDKKLSDILDDDLFDDDLFKDLDSKSSLDKSDFYQGLVGEKAILEDPDKIKIPGIEQEKQQDKISIQGPELEGGGSMGSDVDD